MLPIFLSSILFFAPITLVSKCVELPPEQAAACKHDVEHGRPYSFDVADSASQFPSDPSKKMEKSLEKIADATSTLAWVSVAQMVIYAVVAFIVMTK